MESLKKQTVKGTIWSTIERFTAQGISFLVVIVMARLLTPDDYGLVGMLSIFVAISQSLIDSGFSQALIRKQDRTEIDNSTVFIFNIAIGVILYLILFFAAPFIADFYHEPQLSILTRVVCISLLINSFVVVQRALFTINVDFKSQSKATAIGALISGVIGIAMAYLGFGVWAIVGQQLTNQFATAVLLWVMSKWRPACAFSIQSFKTLFSFGSKLAISGLINTAYTNMYLITIGKYFNAADLGYYTRAKQFADFPSGNLTQIIQRVTFPILCTIQNDMNRLRNAYRRFLRVTSFIIFPIMMILAGVSKVFILTILTEKWIFTSTLLTILCFSCMLFPVHAINLNVLSVNGRSDLFLKLEIWKKIVGVCIMIITIPFGIVAMCYGMILSSVISLVINTWYTKKLMQLSLWIQMKDLAPTMLYALSTFAVSLLVSGLITQPAWSLVASSVIGASWYIGIARITQSRDLKEVINLIKNR